MNELSKLERCPHCGKLVAELTSCAELEECANFESCCAEPFVCVVCNANDGGCGATGGYAATVEDAIEKWNRRAVPPNEALKFDELFKLDGEAVYVVHLWPTEYGIKDRWYLVNVGDEELISTTGHLTFTEACGVCGMAYLRKPEPEGGASDA